MSSSIECVTVFLGERLCEYSAILWHITDATAIFAGQPVPRQFMVSEGALLNH